MLKALSRLLVDLDSLEQEPSCPLALMGDTGRTRAEFLAQVLHLAQSLSRMPDRSWGLFLENGYDFAVAFLALLQADKYPILLPSAQPAFLEGLQGRVDTIIQQELFEELSLARSRGNRQLRALDAEGVGFALFTSGSTGEPKLIGKSLANVEAELACLEATFGSRLDQTVHLSTVSHQHIYGMLFSVLWPLCAGRIFDGRAYHYPDELMERINVHDKVALVSSPAHLNRLAELVDLPSYRARVSAVFSSGGPLHERAALALKAALGQAPIEVFGSTETGGIAYRSRGARGDSDLWTPFSVLELRQETESGGLTVRSPYIDQTIWHPLEDRGQLYPDGTFRLLGRADRIVKVEGKRLSLQEIENRLLQSALVSDARAILRQEARSYVAVVLAPTKEGKELLGQVGAAKFKALIKGELAGYFERVLLPRKWRIVDEISLNRLGKTTQESLDNLFKQESTVEPTVVSVSTSEHQIELDLQVPESTKYFEGHFPEHPVLPGVAQIDWAVELATRYLSISGRFQRLEAVKFHEFIRPQARVQLSLRYRPDNGKLYFIYAGDGGKHSSGRIVFG